MAPKRAAFAHSTNARPLKRQKKTQETLKSSPTLPTKISAKAKIAVATTTDTSTSSRKFMIVAGSYEKLLYGLEGSISNTNEWSLKPAFIFPAHVSCIKAVAASSNGKWLATGSTDEIIKIWDLKRRKEVGGLMHHQGSITHLLFPSKSHLMSCSEDGTLALFHTRDWAVLRTLKGHKGRVNSIGVHPSGKLALSVGKDRTLRMWDLMRGKGCASMKLGKEAELVRWSKDGNMFFVQFNSSIQIYATDMQELSTITHPSRVVDIHPCRLNDQDILLVGAEDKKVTAYSLNDPSSPKIVGAYAGHSNRVKSIQTYVASPNITVLCTVSSDGRVHLYDLAAVQPPSPDYVDNSPKAFYDTKGTRLTCLTVGDIESKDTSEARGNASPEDSSDEEWDEQDDSVGEREPDSEDREDEEENLLEVEEEET